MVAAERTMNVIIEAYLAPNLSMHDVPRDVRERGFHFLVEFGEACRQADLARD